jgi:hypothetical protein
MSQNRIVRRTLGLASLVIVAGVPLFLAACAPAYENGNLSRFINRQEEARDACLSRHVVSLDDGRSAPDRIGHEAASACGPENDRLIRAMSTVDPSGVPQIANAVRKDSVVKATSYVLEARAQARR